MSAVRRAAIQGVHLARDAREELAYRARAVRWNRKARRCPVPDVASMTPSQGALLDGLRESGLALLDVRSLVDDEELLHDLDQVAQTFTKSDAVRRQTASFLAGEASNAFGNKEFLVRLVPDGASLPLEHPLVRITTAPALFDVVTAYMGLAPKVSYTDIWYTIPSGDASLKRTQSQRWHRDWEDKRQVKAFIYLSDVSVGSGALEYAVGSAVTARRHPRQWVRHSRVYPEGRRLDRLLEGRRIVRAEGPTWSLVLCDTTGLHRGGRAISDPRLVATWLYVSPASLATRRFTPQGEPRPSDWRMRKAIA